MERAALLPGIDYNPACGNYQLRDNERHCAHKPADCVGDGFAAGARSQRVVLDPDDFLNVLGD